MNRNFYIALIVSVIVHSLLLLIWISIEPGDNSAHGEANTSPTLTYRLEVSDSSNPADKPLEDAEAMSATSVTDTPPSSQQIAEISSPSDPPVRRPTPAQQVPVASMENEAIDTTEAVSESVAESHSAPVPEIDNQSVTALEIVTAKVRDDSPDIVVPPPAREPEPVKQALSTRQEKMLNKKLRKWTESLDPEDRQDASLEWKHKGKEYTARLRTQAPVSDTGIDRVIVEISTEENGQRVSTELQMKRLAFSSFAQFVNRWDPNVQLHDDELKGRFHANSAISIEKSGGIAPTFHGKVTTVARRVDIKRSGNSKKLADIFVGGLETGVRRITLPKRYVPFAADHPTEEQQIHNITGDTRIVFQANGTYEWSPIDDPTRTTTHVMSDATTYIIGAHKSALYVSGTVKGRVLVSTPDDIVIEQNLLYAHDPATTPDGDDYLGLVSDRNVVIAHPDVTGSGDLRVHASIFAKHRFAVKHYRAKEDSILYIYGSITAGSLTATEPRYQTKIEYDPRLEEWRAPGFPLTNRYEMVSWDRQWSYTDEDDLDE